jgi:hypothetical protein
LKKTGMKQPRMILLAVAGCLSAYALCAQQLQHPVAISANSNTMVSRAPDSRGWTDPALNHNRLLQQQTGDGVYMLVGPYKVVGSPYLFGEHRKGDMFTPDAKAWNIYLSYNTYNQELSFYSSSNPAQPLVREPGTVDSFFLQTDTAVGIRTGQLFVSSASLGVKEKEKGYFLVLYRGPQYSLYKRYKSELGFVQTNITQPDLRQFDLVYDYYYAAPDVKGLRRFKATVAGLEKEFGKTRDLSGILTGDAFVQDPEACMRRVFTLLNQ